MARDDEPETGGENVGAAGESSPLTADQRPSTSTSKERGGTQDSRPTARLGEEPNAQSTRVTEGRGIAARIAEHEARVGHKEMDEETAIKFEKAGRRRKE